jgi:hypothetical protein
MSPNPPNSPTKHHFSPAFSLQPWTGADGLVCQMRMINGTVAPLRVHPNATGFTKNLYRTDGVPADQAQHLEEKFFKPVDTQAESALRRMLAMDRAPWPEQLRKAWTVYILSLMFRSPETVQLVKGHVATMWGEGLQALEHDYDARRLPSDPADFAGYLALTNPATAQISATNMLMSIIDNDRLGPTIFGMNWSVVRLQGSKFGLLMSDRPIDRPFGLGDPRGYIAMPIGPDRIFLAANDSHFGKRVSARSATDVAKALNKLVVSRAKEYVWDVDDSQLAFVRKHMGKSPLPPAITEEQRAEVVAAARGEK